MNDESVPHGGEQRFRGDNIYESFPPEFFPFTSHILQYSPLPALPDAEGVAERLLLILHYGADFNIWGGHRRHKYWGAFQERVIAASYSGPDLTDWWSQITVSLPSEPRNRKEREEAGRLVYYAEGSDVVKTLRRNAPAYILRTRIAAEHYRDRGNTGSAGEGEEET